MGGMGGTDSLPLKRRKNCRGTPRAWVQGKDQNLGGTRQTPWPAVLSSEGAIKRQTRRLHACVLFQLSKQLGSVRVLAGVLLSPSGPRPGSVHTGNEDQVMNVCRFQAPAVLPLRHRQGVLPATALLEPFQAVSTCQRCSFFSLAISALVSTPRSSPSLSTTCGVRPQQVLL